MYFCRGPIIWPTSQRVQPVAKVIRVNAESLKNQKYLFKPKAIQGIYNGRHAIRKKHSEYSYFLSVVYAGGVARTKSVIILAKVWGNSSHGEDARRVDIIKIPLCHELADLRAMEVCIEKYLQQYPCLTILLDTCGEGLILGHLLQSKGIYFKAIHWGSRCFLKKNDRQFVNRRIQAYVSSSRAMTQGRFKVHTKQYKPLVEEQLRQMIFKEDSKGRYQLFTREEMRRRGLICPDISDTFAFLFLEGTNYKSA